MAFKPSKSFWKVIALLGVFTLAPLSMVVVYYHLGGLPSDEERTLQRNLRFAFMAGSDAIDLAPLVSWPWVKVCALDSGLSREEVGTIVGLSDTGYDQIFWAARPEFWTLLFIDSERSTGLAAIRKVRPIRIPRKDVASLGLPGGVKGQCMMRDSGRLELTRATAPPGESPVIVHLVDSAGD